MARSHTNHLHSEELEEHSRHSLYNRLRVHHQELEELGLGTNTGDLWIASKFHAE